MHLMHSSDERNKVSVMCDKVCTASGEVVKFGIVLLRIYNDAAFQIEISFNSTFLYRE